MAGTGAIGILNVKGSGDVLASGMGFLAFRTLLMRCCR